MRGFAEGYQRAHASNMINLIEDDDEQNEVVILDSWTANSVVSRVLSFNWRFSYVISFLLRVKTKKVGQSILARLNMRFLLLGTVRHPSEPISLLQCKKTMLGDPVWLP